MIAAIDGRAGLPTDKPAALQAPTRGHQFSQVLETVHQETPKAPPARSRPAETQETQGRTMARRQAAEAAPERETANPQPAHARRSAGEEAPTGRGADKSDDAADATPNEPERPERKSGSDDSNAVMPDPSSLRMPAQPQPLTAQQIAAAQPQDPQALAFPAQEPTLAKGYAPSGQVGSSIQAQLGRAAYNLTPHGVGEPVQPANPAAASAGAAAALQAADPEQQATQVDLHVVSTQEMVQLSNAARASLVAEQEGGVKTAADTGERRKTTGSDPDSAQSRNQVLQQIGGPAGAAPIQAAAASNAGQGGTGSLNSQAHGAALPKEVKLDAAQPVTTATDATQAAGLAAGAAGLGAAHQSRENQAAADGGQKLDPAMLNKIVQESRWLIRSGHSEATFKLQPENLGEVRLKVIHKDGELTVQMTVDSLATKHLLEANFKELRQQLQQDNLAQGNLLLNVDVRQGADSGGFSGFAQRAAQEGGVQAAGTAPVEEVSAAAGAQPARWSNSNISIYA